ncbi:MAG: hypothetical protein BGO04_15085 [Microbacterium sp. 70-38]|nr:MAG: hypothetical protein BGO04_15085 [Microbacterium sp. 70-38]
MSHLVPMSGLVPLRILVDLGPIRHEVRLTLLCDPSPLPDVVLLGEALSVGRLVVPGALAILRPAVLRTRGRFSRVTGSRATLPRGLSFQCVYALPVLLAVSRPVGQDAVGIGRVPLPPSLAASLAPLIILV